MEFSQWLGLVQGIYYAITGIWPLFSIRTFQAVTGPKRDCWLVQQVGLLAAAIGIPLAFFSAIDPVPSELRWVAVLSAFSFLAIDVYYRLKRIIGNLYLADAVLQVVFIACWAVLSLQG